MIHVGVDVHKGVSRVMTFGPATGEVQRLGGVPTQWEQLCAAVGQLAGEKTVVLEAGRNGHFLAAQLEAVAERVWTIDPAARRTLVGRGPKTDDQRRGGWRSGSSRPCGGTPRGRWRCES